MLTHAQSTLPPRGRWISDRSTSIDLLDRGPFVDVICDILVGERAADSSLKPDFKRGLSIGLTGEWGSGKSTIVNMVYERLSSKDRVLCTLINPWLLGSRDDLLRGFFSSLATMFAISKVEAIRLLARDVRRYASAAGITLGLGSVLADAATGTTSFSSALPMLKESALRLFDRPVDLQRAKDRLEDNIRKSGVRVVVLIDELDRIEDEEVRTVARLIKAIGDIDGISYLTAYDPIRVAQALGRESAEGLQESGEAYLEKIVQFSIPIRPFNIFDIDLLIGQIVDEKHILNSSSGEGSDIVSLVRSNIRTPRDLKRLIGSFDVFKEVARQEICDQDILAYSWITVKYPKQHKLLYDSPNLFIDDPEPEEQIRRVFLSDSKVDFFEERLDNNEDAIKVFRSIFPRVGSDKNSASNDPSWNRISRRRNLYRLLYLGDAPREIYSRHVRDVYQLGSIEDIESRLRGLHAESKLGEFLDVLEEVIVDLDHTSAVTFWLALANISHRGGRWIEKDDGLRQIARSAADALIRWGRRDENSGFHVARILLALREHGDFSIAPSVVRHELFAHGMVRDFSSRGDNIFDIEQVKGIYASESVRYIDYIQSGQFLRDAVNVDPIFALLNMEDWTSDLKESLLSQMVSSEAVSTFAALLTPPGWTLDLVTLDKIVEVTQLRSILDKTDPGVGDTWVQLARRRLVRVANGQDIHFDRDG